MAPPEIREMRVALRFRTLVVRQSTQVKNRMASTLMQYGVEYTKEKLHRKAYFRDLMAELGEVPDSVRMLLGRSRGVLEMFKASERMLTSGLERDPRLKTRVELLQTIPGVGPVTALTWALEIGDPARFPSASHAVSYCGLVAGRQQSGEREYRQPLSKQRNEHLQTTLIEAAHLAQRYNPVLRAVYEKVKREVHGGAAVLAVARKLVAYLMAVDTSGKPFEVRQTPEPALSSPTGSAFPSPPPVSRERVAQRSSPSRVRVAAPNCGAPLTAAGRCAELRGATGGSDGKARRK
jgi:transposase